MNLSRNLHRRQVRQSGFTLLEVLVAIAIVAIALTSLFSSQSTSLSLAIEAKFNTTSTFLAREVFAGYESGLTPFSSGEGDFGEEFAGYSWKTEVEQASFGDLATGSEDTGQLYRVDLEISWSEASYVAEFTWIGREAANDN